MNHMDNVALFSAPSIYFLIWFLMPFFLPCEKINGKKYVEDRQVVTEDKIREWINASESEGTIEEDETEMF